MSCRLIALTKARATFSAESFMPTLYCAELSIPVQIMVETAHASSAPEVRACFAASSPQPKKEGFALTITIRAFPIQA
jgi:hypothetical protein